MYVGWSRKSQDEEARNLPAPVAKLPSHDGAQLTQPLSSLPTLRIPVYVFCLALLLALISFNFVDIDLWHQMALIRASLQAGHLLTQDPFAYTPTVYPMMDHEWGAGVLAFFFTKWLGGAGILLLKFAAAFGVLGLAMQLAELRGASPAVLAFLAPLGIFLCYLGFLPAVRAHAYSFLFTASLLWIFEKDRHGHGGWLLAAAVCFPLWVNLHGGFVVGLGFVFLYAIEQALQRHPYRHVLLVVMMFALGTFANPYGLHYFDYLARALTMARPRIPEWGPVWTLDWPLALVYVIAIIAFLYGLAQARTWRLPGVLLISVSAAEALRHRKLLPFFAIVWIAYVPAMLQNTPAGEWLQAFAEHRRRFLVLACSVLTAVCLIAAIRTPFWRTQVPQVSGEASYPVGAVEYLRQQNFHGNVMVPFRAGAYVSWKLYPAVRVSIDSRYEVAYPDAWVERSFLFYDGGAGWQSTLTAYPTDLVLTRKTARVQSLLQGLNWHSVYTDAEFELLARPGLTLPVMDRNTTHFAGAFP